MKSGILLIDKPEGPTSHDVVRTLRRALAIKRIGHAGTLDPFATGLLVILIAKGTKLSVHLTDHDKKYIARLRWGQKTDSGDLSGEIIESTDKPLPDKTEIEKAMKALVGDQLQTPPMYSAKKVNGRPLYESARKGLMIKRDPVPIKIYHLTLLDLDDCGFGFEVHCSKGTYIRTLAEQIAEKLGGFAYLTSLRRTQSGPYRIADSITLDDAVTLAQANKLESKMMVLDRACSHYPAVRLDEKGARSMSFGQTPTLEQITAMDTFKQGELIRILSPDETLLALAYPSRDSNALNYTESEEKIFQIDHNFSGDHSE